MVQRTMINHYEVHPQDLLDYYRYNREDLEENKTYSDQYYLSAAITIGDICINLSSKTYTEPKFSNPDKEELPEAKTTGFKIMDQNPQYINAETAVIKRIRELNEGWVPDYDNHEQAKYFIEYDFSRKILTSEHCFVYKSFRDCFYLKSEEIARQLVGDMEDEIKIMLGVK